MGAPVVEVNQASDREFTGYASPHKESSRSAAQERYPVHPPPWPARRSRRPRDAHLAGSPGFSIDASVRILGEYRAGVERLLRYCAPPPFALERLHAPGRVVSAKGRQVFGY